MSIVYGGRPSAHCTARRVGTRAANSPPAHDGGLRRSLASWISGPKEILAFVPRLSTGAILMGPAIVSELNIGLQQVNTLMNDAVMTDEEKREAVARVIDDQLDAVLVRGTELESKVWQQIEPMLPSSAAEVFRPSHPFLDDWDTFDEPISSTPSVPTEQLVTDGSIARVPAEMPTAESRSSAALVQLRSAVTELQAALEAVDDNKAPSSAVVLKLNVREAWDKLRMRIMEVESSADIEGSDIAAAEASQLVDEVAAAFDFPQI
eukprot:jgi/Ulvmu1/5287/UM022_0081.1